MNWNQVWENWKVREDGYWDEHIKERGFDSWGTWRSKFVEPFGLQDREWAVIEITNPEEFIQNVYAGAFKGWQKYLDGVEEITFGALVKNPDVQANPKIQGVLEDFPQETELILFKCGDEYVLFEGMHRACALAIAGMKGEKISGAVRAAVTEFSEAERDLFTKAKQNINKEA